MSAIKSFRIQKVRLQSLRINAIFNFNVRKKCGFKTKSHQFSKTFTEYLNDYSSLEKSQRPIYMHWCRNVITLRDDSLKDMRQAV